MVVIGIDFGNYSSLVVACDQKNRFRTVLNDFNERLTPSVVAFDDKTRIFGTAAKNQHVTNITKTIVDFKFELQKDMLVSIYRKIHFRGNELPLGNEQIVAMFLAKLKIDSMQYLKEPITNCVISVPLYYTQMAKNRLLVAARIAGLNCSGLIDDTEAIAQFYEFGKMFSTKPRIVVFVNFGHTCFQIAAYAFDDKGHDLICKDFKTIGGRDIDNLMVNYFYEKVGSDGWNSSEKEVRLSLLQEVEKLKIKFTSDDMEYEIDVAHLLKDPTTRLSMDRSEMEKLCKVNFEMLQIIMSKFVENPKLQAIHSVELIGGSSRIPLIRQIISHIFIHHVEKLSMTLNSDECIAKGAALKFLHLINFYVSDSDQKAWQLQMHPNFIDVHDLMGLPPPVSVEFFREWSNLEVNLEHGDAEENRRVELRNSLEELINDIVFKLQSYENTAHDNLFAEKVKNLNIKQIKKWLYGSGKSATSAVINNVRTGLIAKYNDLEKHLKTLHQPINKDIEPGSSAKTKDISQSAPVENLTQNDYQKPLPKSILFTQLAWPELYAEFSTITFSNNQYNNARLSHYEAWIREEKRIPSPIRKIFWEHINLMLYANTEAIFEESFDCFKKLFNIENVDVPTKVPKVKSTSL